MNQDIISGNTFWTKRYEEARTGWDIGYPSTPLKEYIDQLEDKTIKILIPGAGNAYEAEYLFQQGFYNIHILDISKIPLEQFAERVPNFPKENLIHNDFFKLEGQYDLILEQTFFCSFPPLLATRKAYVKKMHELLKSNGKLVGVWFDMPLKGDLVKRPFGGDKEEYFGYFQPWFEVAILEKCYNSIEARNGNELFCIYKK